MTFNIKSLSMATKIPAIIIAVGVISGMAASTLSYFGARDAVKSEAEAKLLAVTDARNTALKSWIETIEADLITQASNPTTRGALAAFIEGWQGLDQNQTALLQELYIKKNVHPLGEKEKLDAAPDGSRYSKAHARFHPYFRTFLRSRGYYDIFLFDTKGNLVYSVFKENDYATNVMDGEWSATDLGNAFRAAAQNPSADKVAFFDFKPYAPSNNAPASFISTPLVDISGKLEGVLIFQMPIGTLNALMQQTAGLGETGETYLVGSDLLMRSDSRFTENSTILSTKIDTEPARAAISGKSGIVVADDYRGQSVVSAFTPFTYRGTTWAVLAEQDQAETFAPIAALLETLVIETAIGVVVMALFGYIVGRRFSRPIGHATETMTRLAQGDTSVKVAGMERGDEIGEMARAVEVFRENAVERAKMRSVQEEQKQQAEIEKQEMMNALASNFETDVGSIVETVSSASSELDELAGAMSSVSETALEKSTLVSTASHEASSNVQTVAAATEQMSHSIAEINQQVDRASVSARQAVDNVQDTSQQVASLASTADKIGDVVKLISDIAEQTNLLALNATIESARAGEAGKGFAVVASEVKQLASQTSSATEEINKQIEEVQLATRQVVSSMGDISTVIGELDQSSAAIAVTMEQQGSAIQEIARNVQEAATGTSAVTNNMTDVTDAAKDVGNTTGLVKAASGQLSQQSVLLSDQVAKFVEKIRAA